MRKIGIITFHASENFGSALQAFALENILIDNGYNAEIINCILESDMKQYNVFRTHIYLKRPMALLGDFLYLFRNIKRKKSFLIFQNKYLKISYQLLRAGKDDLSFLNEEYDVFICGSDQIWNLNCTGRYVPEFFLDFADDSKLKIAYAPSMPSDVSEQYYDNIRKAVERLDAVSVREKYTVEYLRKNVGVRKDIIQTLDPTLLLGAEYYIKAFDLKRNNEKYIFVYILSGKNDIKSVVNLAVKTAKETELKIKYVYARRIMDFTGGEYLLGIDPVNFLDLIYNAAYVITDSFHATVFSVQFQKCFCVVPRSGSKSRMIELLEELDLHDNLYSPNNNQWMESKANEKTRIKLGLLAEKSLNFLKDSLKIEK